MRRALARAIACIVVGAAVALVVALISGARRPAEGWWFGELEEWTVATFSDAMTDRIEAGLHPDYAKRRPEWLVRLHDHIGLPTPFAPVEAFDLRVLRFREAPFFYAVCRAG
jgi:hypothetical protein